MEAEAINLEKKWKTVKEHLFRLKEKRATARQG
jgi:hypothetical protein